MKKTKLTIPDVMHVNKKGEIERKPLVVHFDPSTREFLAQLPKEVAQQLGVESGLAYFNLANLIEDFEAFLNNYQRNILLAGAEEVIWLRVMHLSETNTSASIFMAAERALVRRDKVTGLIVHATALINGGAGKPISIDVDRPIFLEKTEANLAKVERLLRSIETAYKTISSIASRGQLEWQPAFDSIIEMHSTMVPADSQPAPAEPEQPKAEPVQQSLLPADDEEL